MIGDCDKCICGSEAICVHLPDGHEGMTAAAKEYYHYVTCADCNKILRYVGTRRRYYDEAFNWETY